MMLVANTQKAGECLSHVATLRYDTSQHVHTYVSARAYDRQPLLYSLWLAERTLTRIWDNA